MRNLSRLSLFSFVLVSMASANVLGPLSGTGWNASAFNVVTLGVLSGNVDNAPVLAGSFSSNNDIGGGVAAYGNVSDANTLTNGGVTNPYTDAFNVIVNGSTSSTSIKACGSVYLGGGGSVSPVGCGNPTVSSTGLDFNFSAARTSLENYSYNVLTSSTLNQVNLLGSPTPVSGQPYQYSLTIPSPSTAGPVYVDLNPAWLTAGSLNINYNKSLVTAVVFNVAGSSVSTGNFEFYYNGSQPTGNDFGGNPILFNFYQATSVTLNNVFDASVLAPFATLTSNQDLLGQAIVGQLNSVGETHDDYFNGTGLVTTAITSTPEPMTFGLLGCGLFFIGALSRKLGK
jgi:hypothetical protein